MDKKKILFIDIYRELGYRINKDVNGGYGTGNNYGGNGFTRFLARYQKESIFWPPLYFVSTISAVHNLGHQCQYSTELIFTESFDIFIFSSSIVTCESEIKAAQQLKYLGKPILFVGSFASNNPEKYIEAGFNVLIGEPDTSIWFNPEIINSLSSESQKISPAVLEGDVNQLPEPNWEIILKHKKPVMGFLGSGTSIPLSSSRGCPYSCFNYCVYPLQQGRRSRLESAQRVVNQLEYYRNYLGVKSFLFRDPVFTLNRGHVIQICEEIIRRKLKIVWGAELHLKDLDKELIKIMSRAGLRIVFVGIESINPESIKETRRQNATNEQQLRSIRELENQGISVKAMFIIGFPGDNMKNAIKTIEYASKLPVTYLQFSVFTPYPGTPIYSEYKDRIIASKFEDYTQWDLVFKHENLRPEDVKFLLTKAYGIFYTSAFRLIKITYRLLKIEARKRFGFF